MQMINALMKAIRSAAVFNPEVQVAPACVLWPDQDRQWEAIIPRLLKEIPELLVLGDYSPEMRTGPAIWLRCVMARKIHEVSLEEDAITICYLPGVSRQDLRAIEECPQHLKPLAEIQYRGVIWSQINAKDWTILAFLKSDQGGLGIDVAQDNDTKNSLKLSLYRLLDEDVEFLKGKKKRLDKDFFNSLVVGDSVKDLLEWFNQGDEFRKNRSANEWRAFVEVSKSQLGFNPESDGPLAGGTKLASHKGPWEPVWKRFCESPLRYPGIPQLIRKCKPPSNSLTWISGEETFDGWPQWNDAQEANLRQELKCLAKVAPHEARKQITKIANDHSARNALVWTELGEAPLARAIMPLAVVAKITSKALAAGKADDLLVEYSSSAWQADDAILQIFEFLNKKEDRDLMSSMVQSIYLPWLEDSAVYLQKISSEYGYPGGTIDTIKTRKPRKSEVVLFVDGLRFDMARRLSAHLSQQGLTVDEQAFWVPLPSVTPTGKPAVSPVSAKIRGIEGNTDFEPAVKETEQSLKGGYHLEKLIEGAGIKILGNSDAQKDSDLAWTECGDIDREGHSRGWKLAKHISVILKEIEERIHQLLHAGWSSIRVVTDHGWLYLPGGLPKTNLPAALVESKWGRCAAIKSGAKTDENLFPWFWNKECSFSLARGVHCYKEGVEYTHGGLSLQECLTLQLTVTPKSQESKGNFEVTDIVWKGLRCTIAAKGEISGLQLDVRKQPGDAKSSLVVGTKQLKDNGTASVVVEDESREGEKVFVILFGDDGTLQYQSETVIGERKK
ncbi:MAG: BREX-1 system phosphatase PglZ type B [Candidatus Riflebacteria bacterium]|nr:BREX-1 system phosphatase PglZ type B [Candidatus Riflebacteria bacterium]